MTVFGRCYRWKQTTNTLHDRKLSNEKQNPQKAAVAVYKTNSKKEKKKLKNNFFLTFPTVAIVDRCCLHIKQPVFKQNNLNKGIIKSSLITKTAASYIISTFEWVRLNWPSQTADRLHPLLILVFLQWFSCQRIYDTFRDCPVPLRHVTVTRVVVAWNFGRAVWSLATRSNLWVIFFVCAKTVLRTFSVCMFLNDYVSCWFMLEKTDEFSYFEWLSNANVS